MTSTTKRPVGLPTLDQFNENSLLNADLVSDTVYSVRDAVKKSVSVREVTASVNSSAETKARPVTSADPSEYQTAAAKLKAAQDAVPKPELNVRDTVEVERVPPKLFFAVGNSNSYCPVINGWQVRLCRYKVGEATAGIRAETVNQLAFHYPAVRLQGYELTQFTLELFAYDQLSLDELNQIHFSLFPPVYPKGNKLQRPKASSFVYPSAQQRGLTYVVPIKPSTSFLVFDQESMGYTGKYTLLQWVQAGTPAYKTNELMGDFAVPSTGDNSSVHNTGWKGGTHG
jgi:hypothetical protein